jgi:WD40 repeat protein
MSTMSRDRTVRSVAIVAALVLATLALQPQPAWSQSRARRAAPPRAGARVPPATQIDVHTDRVASLLFSPDRESLLSASLDGTVRMWWVPQGHLRVALRGHEGGAGDMAISGDGRTLAVTAYSGQVKVWALPEGRLLNTITAPEKMGYRIAMSPDGTLLALGRSDGQLALASLPEAKVRTTVPAHAGSIQAMAFKGNSELVTASEDRTAKVWSVPSGEAVATLRLQSAPMRLALSPDGTLLAAGGGAVQVWSLPDRSLLATLDAHTGILDGLAITPDGKTLVTAGSDGAIRLWTLPHATLARTIRAHPEVNGVVHLAMSADGRTLVSSGWFGKVNVWSAADGRLLATFADDTRWLQSMALSPAGLLASGQQSGLIVIRDLSGLR